MTLKWEGPLFSQVGIALTSKPALSLDQQVELLERRKLTIHDETACRRFLASENYYRFAGWARYFQNAPHLGDNDFHPGTTFDAIQAIYDADRAIRNSLAAQLTHAELALRSHVAHVIARTYGPRGRYLEQDFYSDIGDAEPTVESCLRDIRRSKEPHILRFRATDEDQLFAELPVWSAVDAWSFGTLSKCIERGASGALSDQVAASLGVASAGFAYRVRALVYIRNRCAHHSRIWNHSVIDSGPTPNNVRVKAKKLAGQFEPRSVLDVVASLDDLVKRSSGRSPILPSFVTTYKANAKLWEGLCRPVSPKDHI